MGNLAQRLPQVLRIVLILACRRSSTSPNLLHATQSLPHTRTPDLQPCNTRTPADYRSSIPRVVQGFVTHLTSPSWARVERPEAQNVQEAPMSCGPVMRGGGERTNATDVSLVTTAPAESSIAAQRGLCL